MALTKVTKNMATVTPVGTADIVDGAITTAKIAAGAVITADIADNAVTVAKLAATLDLTGRTVTLPDLSVTAAKLANALDLTGKTVSLSATAIPDNGVSNAKILDSSVGFSKLDSAMKSRAVSAYVGFDGSGANGAKTLRDASGVSGVTQNNAGDYTISFSSAYPNTSYLVFGTCGTPGTGWGIVDVFGVATGSVRVITRNSAGTATGTYTRVDIMILKV
jgi:hypothetical protein